MSSMNDKYHYQEMINIIGVRCIKETCLNTGKEHVFAFSFLKYSEQKINSDFLNPNDFLRIQSAAKTLFPEEFI